MFAPVESPEITELESRVAELDKLVTREKRYDLFSSYRAAQSQLLRLRLEAMSPLDRTEFTERVRRYNKMEGPMLPTQ